MKISILLIFFNFSHFVFANDFGEFSNSVFKKRIDADKCSTVDLRGPDLGPVRNQDTVGWCFAFTAADLISYRLKKKISAVDVSILFYKEMAEMPRDAILSNTNGGESMGATYDAMKNGLCLESDFPSEDYIIPNKMGKNIQVSLVDILKNIESIHDEKLTQVSDCQLGAIPKLFNNLNVNDIKNILSRVDKSSFEMILELQKQNCKERFNPNIKIKMRGGLKSGFDTLAEMDAQLNKSNHVSYNYDANFL